MSFLTFGSSGGFAAIQIGALATASSSIVVMYSPSGLIGTTAAVSGNFASSTVSGFAHAQQPGTTVAITTSLAPSALTTPASAVTLSRAASSIYVATFSSSGGYAPGNSAGTGGGS